MATMTEPKLEWNVGDLYRRFGPMPIGRIRLNPPPGSATEEDVVTIRDREKRLYELVDGILVEKAMGWNEARLATEIATSLSIFVKPRKLGILVGADGMYRLNPGLVRLPDVSFLSRDRIPGRRTPQVSVCPLIPNLAVEVLSAGNTKKEMAEKLLDYFGCGVELVWYVDPAKRTARVFTNPDESRLLRETQALDGGDVLPGFVLPLRELFADPLSDEP
jgi:Uma2 family endonuclease